MKSWEVTIVFNLSVIRLDLTGMNPGPLVPKVRITCDENHIMSQRAELHAYRLKDLHFHGHSSLAVSGESCDVLYCVFIYTIPLNIQS